MWAFVYYYSLVLNWMNNLRPIVSIVLLFALFAMAIGIEVLLMRFTNNFIFGGLIWLAFGVLWMMIIWVLAQKFFRVFFKATRNFFGKCRTNRKFSFKNRY